MDIFNVLRQNPKEQCQVREVFTPVDTSHPVSGLSARSDRDRAIAKGLKQFNTTTASRVAADKQARFGRKGKDTFQYG